MGKAVRAQHSQAGADCVDLSALPTRQRTSGVLPTYSLMKPGGAATIYKICERSLWEEAQRNGMFRGAAIDLQDRFIHFSTAAQVRKTAAKHFAGLADLVLVAVDAQALGDGLRWEPSRGGDLFPHLYGRLPLYAVLWTRPLPLDGHGQHVFPEPMT